MTKAMIRAIILYRLGHITRAGFIESFRHEQALMIWMKRLDDRE